MLRDDARIPLDLYANPKSVAGYSFTNLEGVHRGFDIPYPFAPQPALQFCDLK